MQYKLWAKEFAKDKKLIDTFDFCHIENVHSIKRYVDADNRRWETAITYTHKILVRSGILEGDGISIKWSRWTTLHDVEFE